MQTMIDVDSNNIDAVPGAARRQGVQKYRGIQSSAERYDEACRRCGEVLELGQPQKQRLAVKTHASLYWPKLASRR